MKQLTGVLTVNIYIYIAHLCSSFVQCTTSDQPMMVHRLVYIYYENINILCIDYYLLIIWLNLDISLKYSYIIFTYFVLKVPAHIPYCNWMKQLFITKLVHSCLCHRFLHVLRCQKLNIFIKIRTLHNR